MPGIMQLLGAGPQVIAAAGGGGGSLSVKVGSFAKSTAAATASQAITGIGFIPKALLMWTSGPTAAGSWGAGAHQVLGFTSGASNSFSNSIVLVDADGTFFNSYNRMAAKAFTIVQQVGNASSIGAECDLTSFDSDGFTLSWTTNNSTPYLINYIAIGGAGLANAAAITWNTGTATTNLGVTGVGFKPDVVLHIAAPNIISLPSTALDSSFNLGVMDTHGNQWANGVNGGDGNFPSKEKHWQFTDRCVSRFNINNGATQLNFGFVSMDSDGFTVSRTTNWPSSGSPVISLCLKGPSVKAGAFNKPTGGAPASQAITGLGFAPKGLLLSSAQGITSSAMNAGERFGMGATDGTTVESSAITSKDAATPTTVMKSIDKSTKVFLKANNDASTIDAEADLTSLDSDGFTLSWSTNDAVATELLYLALG